MKPIAWMVAGCLVCWLVAAIFVDRQTSLEFLCGMFGPLLAVSATWILAERTFWQHPESLTSLMAGAFFIKMVFFATYVTVMLRVLSLRPVPFVASFTVYFIGLYLTEALYLRRLFRSGTPASR